MWRELREDAEDELERLGRALAESEEDRADVLGYTPPDQPSSWDRRAAAGVVHECYTGMENVLKRVAKRIDRALPDSASWHADLLRQLAAATDRRPAVLSPGLHTRLLDCLGFRHVARLRYSFDLDWPFLRVHLDSLPGLVADFAGEIRTFLDEMDRRGGTASE